ncbi:DUF4214 domain-containing protein [Teichococcus vastitatis]|uniref:DUF4214 domain-containing protein n=1 Tax=Teichococcus vastitatis TaxID=2307076 RepID=A0ABS9WAH1_9PROT|nr:DUF4214 domain-containing protein [Pseudoroseomonas vastitatis]MCI0756299.1 DUF4214 domain-containing protein [Pseudoroseomonas vastitatis]
MSVVTTGIVGYTPDASLLIVPEGYSQTIWFERDNPAEDVTLVFRPEPGESEQIAREHLGFAQPQVLRFPAGSTGRQTVTIDAVEDGVATDVLTGSWQAVPITGVTAINGPDLQYVGNGLFPIAFANNDGNDEIQNLVGGAGNDVFTALGSDDTIEAGAGLDTAVFRGPRSEYTVEPGAVRDSVAGRDDTDLIYQVERLQFADGILALDADGHAGQAYRLYQAAFARDPDTAGLKHQVEAMDGGLSLMTVSSNFLASPEFASRYGADPSDASLVTLLYRNVLAREPEAAGFSAHIGGLAAGMPREQLLVNFSESAENQLQTTVEINDGIWLG